VPKSGTEFKELCTTLSLQKPVAILAGEDDLDISESEQPELIFKNLIEFTRFLEEQERMGTDSV